MAKPELCEVIIPTDRWNIRAVSPLDISDGIDGKLHPVLIHPGWAKAPERHTDLMVDLADAGLLPIGVDTRYGYCDQQSVAGQNSIVPRLLHQRYITGTSNPYFDIQGRIQNRWEYRRPTSLLYLCEQLGIGDRSYVGHSEGGRIVSLAALASADLTKNVVIVNGAGSGDSSNGYTRLVRSNGNRIKDLVATKEDVPVALRSALGSFVYAATHLRRTLKEKQVIQNADLWDVVDGLGEQDVPVSVFHAVDDELVDFEESKIEGLRRPWVDFRATEGDHSNVYNSALRQLIAEALLQGSTTVR